MPNRQTDRHRWERLNQPVLYWKTSITLLLHLSNGLHLYIVTIALIWPLSADVALTIFIGLYYMWTHLHLHLHVHVDVDVDVDVYVHWMQHTHTHTQNADFFSQYRTWWLTINPCNGFWPQCASHDHHTPVSYQLTVWRKAVLLGSYHCLHLHGPIQ